jgi:excisionase family DNA binding protein
MYNHEKNGRDLRKLADLTVDEVTSLFLSIQTKAFEKALEKLLPKRDPEKIFYSTKEAAGYLGVSRNTVQKKKKQRLIAYRGKGKTTRFSEAALDRFLAETPTSDRSEQKRDEYRRRTENRRKKK